MTETTYRAGSIRRRITARLQQIRAKAQEAIEHDDPASDDVADLLNDIEDSLAMVRDRIGDLLHARANPDPETTSGNILLCEIDEVENVYDPSKRWVIRWQTAIMPAPSFTYFASLEEAEATAEDWRRAARQERGL